MLDFNKNTGVQMCIIVAIIPIQFSLSLLITNFDFYFIYIWLCHICTTSLSLNLILSLLCDCCLFPQLLSLINSDVRSQFSMVTALFMISFELLLWERCPHFLHFSNVSKHCQQFPILSTFVLT